MCMGCVSSAEAIVMSGAGGLTLLKGSLDRFADLVTGRSIADRRQRTWDLNARFIGDLGLDVDAVLGPRPADAPVKVHVKAPALALHVVVPS